MEVAADPERYILCEKLDLKTVQAIFISKRNLILHNPFGFNHVIEAPNTIIWI